MSFSSPYVMPGSEDIITDFKFNVVHTSSRLIEVVSRGVNVISSVRFHIKKLACCAYRSVVDYLRRKILECFH